VVGQACNELRIDAPDLVGEQLSSTRCSVFGCFGLNKVQTSGFYVVSGWYLLLKNNLKIIEKSIDSVKQTLFYLSYRRRTCLRLNLKNKRKHYEN